MNSKHPDYEQFLHDTINKITALVYEVYQPYENEATANDIAHFHLHINCSMIVRFLLKMQACSKTANGEKPDLQMLLAEFNRIMQTCLDDTMNATKKEELH